MAFTFCLLQQTGDIQKRHFRTYSEITAKLFAVTPIHTNVCQKCDVVRFTGLVWWCFYFPCCPFQLGDMFMLRGRSAKIFEFLRQSSALIRETFCLKFQQNYVIFSPPLSPPYSMLCLWHSWTPACQWLQHWEGSGERWKNDFVS